MPSWSIGSLLDTAAAYLKDKGSDSPRLDAELLLAETLGSDRIHLYTQHDRPLSADEVDRYRALIARRALHEPVAYILRRAHFRHLTLEVGPAVLIPRPETEELVDLVLETLRRRPHWEALRKEPEAESPVGSDSAGRPPLIADVGTGSGAIALSAAQETGERVLAIDDSDDALKVAARNRAATGLEDRVDLRLGDLLNGVADHNLRLVVSNPPYVTSEEMRSLAPAVRLFEPAGALHGGADGLDVYRRLLPEAARALLPGGTVLLEVGSGQADAVAGLATDAGFVLTEVHHDLSGKGRMVAATLPGAPLHGLVDHGLSDPENAFVDALGEALRAGAVIGLPTDTVYGLAARWDSTAGVRRLFAAKGRGEAQPVAVVFSSVEAITEALPDVHPGAMRVMAALLPGPYTFVIRTAVVRPPLVGTPDSLGVRVPDHPSLLRLLSRLQIGVAATSANMTGLKEAPALYQVAPSLLAHCSVALTDPHRDSAVGVPSTVVDLRPLEEGGAALVLREGAVTEVELRQRIAAAGL